MHLNLVSIDWFNMLMTMISVIVLYFILKHFFFEKVNNFMEKRAKEVEDTLQNADDLQKQAQEKLESYNAQLANAEAEGRQIVKVARDEAKSQAKMIMDEANEKARETMEHARKEIRRERFNAQKELRDEVGSLAMMAAEKILEREVDQKTNQDIVDGLIKEAEEKSWN